MNFQVLPVHCTVCIPSQEFLLILHRGFHEQVERALRLDAGKSALFQSVVKQVTVAVVSFQIHIRIYAALDDSLHRDGALTQPRTRFAIVAAWNTFALSSISRRDYQITDTLARKGLAVRVAKPLYCGNILSHTVQPRRRKPAHGTAHRTEARSMSKFLLFLSKIAAIFCSVSSE